MLPFVDAAALYERYRKDEPWDSENNKKVLDEMPAFFRDPQCDPTSKNSSYFVVTGPGTVFDNKEGTPLSRIVDGTSNTLLAVEAKRDIPWTRPEDLPYDGNQPLPSFGGYYAEGFNALICDGSVRFVSKKVEEPILRLLITKADGQPIPQF